MTARTDPIVFVRVIPEGQSAERLDLSGRVLSLVYEDSETKADKLVLTVDNWDLSHFDDPVWKKGNLLEVSWGYPGEMAPAREVVIQKVTGFQTLSVEAHATSVLMHKVTRCRTFEHLTRADVVRRIAKEHGYGSEQQHIEDTGEVLPVLAQARMTDAQFLRRLAAKEGFGFYVDFDGLHFHPRRLGARPVRVFRWTTAQTVGEVLSIHIENDVTAKPGAVRVRGRDPITKKDIDARGSDTTTERDTLMPLVEIVDPETGRLERRNVSEEIRPTGEASPQAARREADARYKQVQQTTVELSATVLGDPNVLAKTIVQFQGIGQRLSGKYHIKEARHRIDGSGYVVELKCLSDGTQQAASDVAAPSKGRPNQERVVDLDALQALEAVDPDTGRTTFRFVDTRGRG